VKQIRSPYAVTLRAAPGDVKTFAALPSGNPLNAGDRVTAVVLVASQWGKPFGLPPGFQPASAGRLSTGP